MQVKVTLDDDLVREAREVTKLQSDRELLETSLRALIGTGLAANQGDNPSSSGDSTANALTELLASPFIGCADTAVHPELSANYKEALKESAGEI